MHPLGEAGAPRWVPGANCQWDMLLGQVHCWEMGCSSRVVRAREGFGLLPSITSIACLLSHAGPLLLFLPLACVTFFH